MEVDFAKKPLVPACLLVHIVEVDFAKKPLVPACLLVHIVEAGRACKRERRELKISSLEEDLSMLKSSFISFAFFDSDRNSYYKLKAGKFSFIYSEYCNMFAVTRIAVRAVVASNTPHSFPTLPGIGPGQRGTPSLLVSRRFGRGQGDAGGWPSTTGNPSGGGRSNNPPQALEKERDARGRNLWYSLHQGDFVDKNFDERVTSIEEKPQ